MRSSKLELEEKLTWWFMGSSSPAPFALCCCWTEGYGLEEGDTCCWRPSPLPLSRALSAPRRTLRLSRCRCHSCRLGRCLRRVLLLLLLLLLGS